MRIGVPKEIKDGEDRVAVTPDGVRRLVAAGHELAVERGAGLGSGFDDTDYASAGASLVDTAAAWDRDLVVKVKEPVAAEHGHLGRQILFSYLHLAGVDPGLTEALLAAGTTAIAYESVEDAKGRRPLLAPMSAIAGSMAPIVGSHHLAAPGGGRGVLIAAIEGGRHGKVVVIGDGTVGRHAATVAAAMGGRVLVFGIEAANRAVIEGLAPGIEFVQSTPDSLTAHLRDADLVIGAVLIAGSRAPKIVTEAMVAGMPAGAVIVDVSIDQGGCVETSRPTTHSDPVFTAHGVIHYCVSNMPGAYPRTSTFALMRATLPYIEAIARDGLDGVRADPGFAAGINVSDGLIRLEPVASSLGRLDVYRPL